MVCAKKCAPMLPHSILFSKEVEELVKFFGQKLLLFCCVGLAFSACTHNRAPIPPGLVPAQHELSASDEEYGHEVLSGLTDQYKLSNDDVKINRVREIADRLTRAAQSDHNPWHVYVFDDAKFKNAAATRGNYIFVWSAMIDTVQSDDELATILAHEIGHVLAGHTKSDPSEEVTSIMTGAAGKIAHEVIAAQGGSWGLAAGLAEAIVSEGLQAVIVNPESQRKELEADEIGLFMMSDAGYDPEQALEFWRRAESDPELSGAGVSFLSSHPSSDIRLKNLEQYISDAELRYQAATGRPKNSKLAKRAQSESSDHTGWYVSDDWATIYREASTNSEVALDLPHNTSLEAAPFKKGWLRVNQPVEGFVKSSQVSKN